MNKNIRFWFETSVNGTLCFETTFDFFRATWDSSTVTDKQVVLSGNLNCNLSEDEMAEEIKPQLEAAIRSGQI